MPRSALIVTDSAGPTELVASVLQRQGFAPFESVGNCAEAAQSLRAGHFDLVILPLQRISAAELAAVERETRRSGNTFVIGTAPHADPELIVRAMRSGVHEFLIHPPDPNELSAAVDRLMRRAGSAARRGSAIAVYSAKGGVGSTTVAVNLAFALAKEHPDGRVALVDFTTGGGDVRVMLDLRSPYDTGDLAGKSEGIDAEFLHSLLTPVSGGVWVLPASEDPAGNEALDGGAVTKIVDHLRANFAYTVMDCEHTLGERALAALDAADRIGLVTQLDVPSLRSTQRTLSLCGRLGYADDRLHVLVNRFHSGDLVSLSDAAGVLGRDVSFTLPNDYRTASAALIKGVTIVEYDADSKLAEGYTALAGRLNGGIDEPAGGGRRASRLGRMFGRGRKG
jgi:pilus assembly protein CpaE